jgi:thioesterase domain-containing protein
VVCLSENAGKTPLFTLHAFNGNVLGYKKIAHRLKDFSVFDLRLQIDEAPSEPLISVEEYAARAVSLILKQQPGGPYFLSGYSAYGVLAFEVARQLRMRGATIGGLILLDSHIGANFSSLMRHRRYVAAAACFTRTALWNLRCARQTGSIKEYFSQRFSGLVPFSKSVAPYTGDAPDCGHVSHSLLLAIGGYRPLSLDCTGVLIKTPQSDEYNAKQSLAWSRMLRSGLEVHYISGDHQTMFKEPHLSMLIDKLQESLRGASYPQAA